MGKNDGKFHAALRFGPGVLLRIEPVKPRVTWAELRATALDNADTLTVHALC